jgi:hypothetical protein
MPSQGMQEQTWFLFLEWVEVQLVLEICKPCLPDTQMESQETRWSRPYACD